VDPQGALISLHLPKTAGSSLLATLETHFGERFVKDYDDRPLHARSGQRHLGALNQGLRFAVRGLPAQADCIHGHFLPLKYRFARSPRPLYFVTWLRDPVQRIQSHYQYWQRVYDPRTAGTLHRRVVEERWSLERFAMSPELRNIYSLFLWGFPLTRFDFIGITEHFAEDFRAFTDRFLGAEVQPQLRNVGPGGTERCYETDPGLAARISTYHARDVALYQRALSLRSQRLAAAGGDQPPGSNWET
jgi:hypothetical protein